MSQPRFVTGASLGGSDHADVGDEQYGPEHDCSHEGEHQIGVVHLVQMVGVVDRPEHSDEQVGKSDKERDTDQLRDRQTVTE